MSETSKAVFLSYASQDAEAAKRICEALRAAGVEVWFDQSELVGGDQWDAKIRGQISSCALFVPIISAATQARREGYFRLEWKLAAQRTHMIADGTPFILPVVIDATRDSEALVPSEFKSVQWSRLPAGGTPAVFVARMRQLLEGGGATETTPPAEASPTARPAPRKARWMGYGWAAVGIGFALFYALRPVWQQPRTLNEPRPASGAPKATAAETLVAKARALLADDPLTTRASVILAEQLAREAVTQDQTNAEAHAVLAWASYVLINERYDDTPQRRIELRDHAEKARLLAPDSVSAEFAMCCHLLVADSRTEALARLQALGERAPDNIPVLFMSARAQIWNNKDAWGPADALYPAELAKLRALSPLGRAHAESLAASLHWVRGEYVESDRANDRGFATGSPVRLNYLSRLLVLLYGWGDLPAARAFVETIPSQLLLEDVFIAHVSTLWLMSGESDKALEVLARTPREMLREARILNPTAMLRGDALAAAGRSAAAAVQWREALRVVDQQLAADPANTSLLATKAELLASLGDRAGAAATFALFEETRHAAAGSSDWASSYEYFVRFGDVDAVLGRLDRYVARDNGRWAGGYHQLRHDPMFAKVRADPRAKPILERAARWLEEMKPGRSTSLPAAPAATPAPDDKSVAVLAFSNLSDDKSNEYFSDGISEELLNVLAKIPGLKVSARTSAFYFKGKEVPIPEIAQQLGVAYVVEGSVRKQGDKVRITAQLIKAVDGFHVWSDTFTRDLKDIFAVQDEIAGLVADQLSLKLGASSAASRAAVEPQAFELYVQARQAWNLRTEEGFARAEQLLNRALEIASDFARAHAALADVWYFQTVTKGITGTFGRPDPPEFTRVLVKIREALTLDPGSAEAHASLGNLLFSSWKYAEAERAYRHAIALNPNYASGHQWLAVLLSYDGRIEEALTESRRARDLDPLSSRITDNYGYTLFLAGRYTEALAMYERAIALQPSNYQAVSFKPLLLAGLGRSDEAIALARALPSSLPVKPSIELGVYAQAGLQREAEAMLPAARASGVVPVSYLLLLLGRTEEAIAALDAGSVDIPGNYLLIDYDQLDGDPRFQKFIAALGWTEARARIKAWRAAHPPEKPEAKK